MSKRRAWIIGAAAAALLLGVALWAWLATSRPATAEETAASFLRALESGDTGAVEAAGIDVSEAALNAFTGAAEFIDQAGVLDVEQSDDTATAQISFTLAGAEHDATLPLIREGGRWLVGPAALGALLVEPTTGTAVSLGGEIVVAGDEIRLLPASYSISAMPIELLSGETSVQVLPGMRGNVPLETRLRSEATTVAQAQLDEHLGSCVEPVEADEQVPTGCGIRIPWGGEFRAVTDIRFHIEQRPTLTLDATEFFAEGGVLVATVTGVGQDGVDRSMTYRTETWSVRGDVRFTTDDLVLSPW